MDSFAVTTSATRAASRPRPGGQGGSCTSARAYGTQSGKPCGSTARPLRYRTRSTGDAGATIWKAYRAPGIAGPLMGSEPTTRRPTRAARYGDRVPAWGGGPVRRMIATFAGVVLALAQAACGGHASPAGSPQPQHTAT